MQNNNLPTELNCFQNDQNINFGPIRESVIFLTARLALILVLFEAIYASAFYFLKLGFSLPLDLHHHTSEVLFVLAIIKIVAEIYLVVYVALSWSTKAYYIEGKKLVKKTGLFVNREEIFLFDRVQTVTQSFLGKILNYGTITFMPASQKSNNNNIVLWGIDNPKRYEDVVVAI